MAKDYYQILGVPATATDAEIKKAYREKARKYHPDVNSATDSETQFKEINEAYQVLSDPQKRATYDQFGNAAFQSGSSGFGNWQKGAGGFDFRTSRTGTGDFSFDFGFGGFADPFDIFEMMFGGASPFARAARKPVYRLRLDFIEAAKGCEKEVEIDSHRTKIKIPAGVNDGSQIQFDQFSIVAEVGHHPIFRRSGFDILVDLTIDYTQAILGDVVKVPTIDGQVTIKLPAGTQPGTQIRLKGKGVQRLRHSGRGDQYLRIQVEIPSKVSREERQLLEKLARISPIR
jgi:DnaJ-class molecular chaperone